MKSCETCSFREHGIRHNNPDHKECHLVHLCRDSEFFPFSHWMDDELKFPEWEYNPIGGGTYDLQLGDPSKNNYTRISLCERGIHVCTDEGEARFSVDWDTCDWRPRKKVKE